MPKTICKKGECDFTSDNYEKAFCPKCGTALLLKCPQCDTKIDDIKANNCGHCGRKYKDEIVISMPSPLGVVNNDRLKF